MGATEISAIEQALITKVYPLKRCSSDVHVRVFRESLDKQMAAGDVAEPVEYFHPVAWFKDEIS